MTDRTTISLLEKANIRPTRIRMALAGFLFDGEDRHVTVEDVITIAEGQNVPVSVASVYNTLNQFAAAGLLKRIMVDGKQTFFDTNIHDHHHIYYEDENRLVDISPDSVTVHDVPVEEGRQINTVDVMIRVSR